MASAALCLPYHLSHPNTAFSECFNSMMWLYYILRFMHCFLPLCARCLQVQSHVAVCAFTVVLSSVLLCSLFALQVCNWIFAAATSLPVACCINDRMYILRQALPLQILLINASLVCSVNSTLAGLQMALTHLFPFQICMIM